MQWMGATAGVEDAERAQLVDVGGVGVGGEALDEELGALSDH